MSALAGQLADRLTRARRQNVLEACRLFPLPYGGAWRGARLRGHPVLAERPVPGTILELVDAAHWRLTGGVRNALVDYAFRVPADDLDTAALDLLFSPGSQWLWLYRGQERLLRALPANRSRALHERLHAVFGAGADNRPTLKTMTPHDDP